MPNNRTHWHQALFCKVRPRVAKLRLIIGLVVQISTRMDKNDALVFVRRGLRRVQDTSLTAHAYVVACSFARVASRLGRVEEGVIITVKESRPFEREGFHTVRVRFKFGAKDGWVSVLGAKTGQILKAWSRDSQ